jgi:hypothetical protein
MIDKYLKKKESACITSTGSSRVLTGVPLLPSLII